MATAEFVRDGTDADAVALENIHVVYVAPEPGSSGVGDYAVDFAAAVAPHVKKLTGYWVPSSRNRTLADVRRETRRLRTLVHECVSAGPTVVHFEQSGASLVPFWGAMLPSSVPVTATIHDPPYPVWWPFATQAILRHRLAHHGVHLPLRPVSNLLQRRMMAGRTVMVLSSIGARETARAMPNTEVLATRILIPPRATLPAPTDRPLALGLFGYLYKAKGFNRLAELRAALDDDIDILVAGRGTESLAGERGVTVLGEVNDAGEDEFFARIRCLAVPYAKNTLYGPVYAASSTVSRAFAYGTPVICSLDGALPEIVSEGGAIGVDGGIEALAERANAVLRDTQALTSLADEVNWLRSDRTAANCAAPLLRAWARSSPRRTP